MAAAPAEGFRRGWTALADSEAFYRFLANPKVTMPKLLAVRVETAVHVYEPKRRPAGEQPIQWMLFTSNVVETAEQAAAVVDH